MSNFSPPGGSKSRANMFPNIRTSPGWPLVVKMEVLEEMKKKMEKSQAKKGQSRRLERSKSKHSKPRDSLGRWVAMGPSSERETEKEEMVKESLSQEVACGTFEERYVGALESLADSMEDLVRIVITRMRWWLWWW